MTQEISSLMQRHTWTADLDDPIASVEAQMKTRSLTWMPVVDSTGTIIGVISAEDLLRAHAEGRDPSGMRAWQLCTYKPIVVRPSDPVSQVARLMVEKGIHHVVVSDGRIIEGVVSSMDFVRTFVTPR